MSKIAAHALTIETARIAAIIAALQTTLGVGTGITNTCGKGAANAKAAILALTDAEQLTALLPAVQRWEEAMPAQGYYYGAVTEWLRAIDRHVGGLNAYCETEAIRVHHLLREALPELLPKYVFPPVTDFGSVALSGADTGVFTEENAIDTALYGDGLIEVVPESLIGASDITGTIHGADYAGNAAQADYTIPSGTVADTVIAIAGTMRFASVRKDLTEAAIIGGSDGDAFRIQTRLDRQPTGLA